MSLKPKALGVNFILFAAILQVGPASIQGQNTPFELFGVSDLVRVFEDGYNCAVDVFGWAEPETKIIVNGSELPVSPDGLFMHNVRLSKDNTVVINAEGKNAKKTIVRSFGVLSG